MILANQTTSLTTYIARPGSPATSAMDHSITFRVGDVDASYKKFIHDFRGKLSFECENFFKGKELAELTRERTYLLTEKRHGSQPRRWIHIHVVNEDKKLVTLAVRDDNVYLLGFRNKKGWYQFGRSKETDEPVVNPAVLFLGCDVEYADMVGSSGDLVNLNLGRSFVNEAVHNLSKYDKKCGDRADKQTRKYLAGLMVIICEAARMDQPYHTVKNGWDNPNRININDDDVEYINNWGHMSGALLCWRNHGCPPDCGFPDTSLRNIGITIPEIAVNIVRLVLRTHPKRYTLEDMQRVKQHHGPSEGEDPSKKRKYEQQSKQDNGRLQQQQQPQPQPPPQQQQQGGHSGGRSSQQQKTAVPPKGTEDYEVNGKPLVEVYSVRARYPFTGSIAIFDGKRGQIMYKNDSTQDSPPSPDDRVPRELPLTGPYRAVSADASFTIEVKIKDGDSTDTGELTWDCCDKNNVYDEPVDREIKTARGRVIEVTFAVLDYAVEANVQVHLRLPEDTAQNRVYGKITARSDGSDLPRVVLLDPKLERGALIGGSGFQLQLARSVLAVPFHCPLIINATLYDKAQGEGIRPIFTWKDLKLTLGKQPSKLRTENGVEVTVKISSPDLAPLRAPRRTTLAPSCSHLVCPKSRPH
ncbi:hypothetical protein ACP70R_047861 [Stipagrostis hirtigluma subsp. patula]